MKMIDKFRKLLMRNVIKSKDGCWDYKKSVEKNGYARIRMKEIVVLARQHNDANIISIPARYTSIPQAVDMVDTFLTTEFEGGRHQNRVDKISC